MMGQLVICCPLVARQTSEASSGVERLLPRGKCCTSERRFEGGVSSSDFEGDVVLDVVCWHYSTESSQLKTGLIAHDKLG